MCGEISLQEWIILSNVVHCTISHELTDLLYIMFDYYIEAFRRYADFEGKSTRPAYWYFVLFNFIISFVVSFVAGMVKIPLLSLVYSLAVFVPSIAAAVRRMHDVGRSGWWILVPLYNIYLAVQPSATPTLETTPSIPAHQ